MSIKFIQLPTCAVNEFVAEAATSFDVSGFLYNDGITPVAIADIGDVCFATLEPRTVREELISFTIDSVTAGGVATITAVRGLSQKSPYGTGGSAFDHQNGSDFVISNNPGLLNKFAVKENDETITAQWSFPDPILDGAPVTKSYYEDTLDTELVHNTGDETIADEKTFTTSPKIPDSGDVDEAVTRGELDAEEVKLTGEQTIAGIKTFSSSPVVPDATTAQQPYTKGQHDADAEASSAVASPTVRGSAKLDAVADDVGDPEVLTATADRVAAIGGGGDFGTPSSTNKFSTEENDRINIAGFGDGSDGDVTISGTTTLTADMQYENLTVTGTLITDGYVIKVRNTIDGAGTIKHSVPIDGGDGGVSGSGANEVSGAGGGSGASGGTILIYAANWDGTFTLESVGGAGGDGSDATLAGSGTVPTGGVAAAQRGSGVYKGSIGKAGGDGNSLISVGIPGAAGDAADPTLQASGSAGGTGGSAGGSPGGSGGGGGIATATTISPLLHKFLLSGLFGIDSTGLLKNVNAMAGAGSGGGGRRDSGDAEVGGGGGGGGGNGGYVVLIYKKKTWSGSSTLTGGAAGAAGAAAGSGAGAGFAGGTGVDGTLEEVNYDELM